MDKVKWTTKKPKGFKEPCLLLTATWIGGDSKYWDYSLFEILRTEGYNDNDEPCWYWGLFSNGDEWGDYEDFKADKYSTLSPLKQK